MAKSKVINGISYEFDGLGKIIGIFDHSDPTNPTIIDPKTDRFKDLAQTDDALTAFNFNRYGVNKDSYDTDTEIPSQKELDAFYETESKDNKENLKETDYPNRDNGLSNPSLAPGPANAYASYKRGQRTGIPNELFAYPLDIDPKQDHLKISRYEYARNDPESDPGAQGSQPVNVETVSTRLNPGERIYNFFAKEENRVEPVKLQRVVEGGSMIGNKYYGSVLLPMPKVVDTNGCEWGESELNIFGLTAVQAADQGKDMIGATVFKRPTKFKDIKGVDAEEADRRAVEQITARAQRGGKLFKRFEGMGSALGNAVVAENLARLTGQTISQDQFLARTSGRVLNPNAELLFQGPVLRDFNFDFLMIARSEQEGKEIRKIIKWFKSGMAPKFNSATFLETPDVFTLEYKNGTRPGDVLKTVNRFSPGGLALRTIAVDYAPSGYWSAYQDSQPVAIKMSLNFAELRPIYADDQNQDGLVDTVGY